uniref:Uncharacterized protein n=1 Tax=Vespula pensylvanica TaxID=30213 RepID=A0A834K100_VESPE|nr:hypothetical protein H0235_016281 [Vespula pensylvanica]
MALSVGLIMQGRQHVYHRVQGNGDEEDAPLRRARKRVPVAVAVGIEAEGQLLERLHSRGAWRPTGTMASGIESLKQVYSSGFQVFIVWFEIQVN